MMGDQYLKDLTIIQNVHKQNHFQIVSTVESISMTLKN